MKRCFLQTPLGICQLLGDEKGVSQLVLVEEATLSVSIPKELKVAVAQIQEYFAGNRTQFDLKLNPAGTDFQKKVWDELQHIPYGKTLSYLELSKKLGDPKAIRAVAAANGKNPLWIIIPCHRVIGSDGSLTGYAGGLWRKKWLLEHESPATQQRLFG
jgi:methylated-DNA-[protein]-cysteine S-methyltransferase